jgi:protein-S-isoprenylcysteine O-methyltransferase Ste14
MLVPGIAAPIAELLGLPTLSLLDRPAVRIVGIAVTAVGVAVSFGAQLAMGTSWRTTVDPTEYPALVTTGVFRIVRNPIYTALIIMVLGLTMLVPNAVALAGMAIILIGAQLQVRIIEEPYLRNVHGNAYFDYASRVGRFLPTIGRLRHHQPDN